MSRPDPIQYAERLYGAIRAANFSPLSFLAFGNAVKDGVPLRNMTRMAAEPFMRVVGEMLDLEEEAASEDEITDADVIIAAATDAVTPPLPPASSEPTTATPEPDVDRTGPAVPGVPATVGTSPATESPVPVSGKKQRKSNDPRS